MSQDNYARYSFIPWLRQGLGLNISQTDGLTVNNPSNIDPNVIYRSTLQVSLEVNASGANATIENPIELMGPGDILGINKQSIVHVEPLENVANFEPNYLPYIEFYEEDFPWRYTPAKANGHKLRPWIFLFVLEKIETGNPEFSYNAGAINILTVLNQGALPPKPEQSWAWAHVHVNEQLADDTNSLPTANTNLNSILNSNPDKAYARLISPRMLKANSSYQAFLVPAFEMGRKAGLGEDVKGIDAMTPSWGNGQTTFPVYHTWEFSTGSNGDFESLVKLLQPRDLDDSIGKKAMDIQESGFGLSYIDNQGFVELEGALKIPGTTSAPFADTNNFKPHLKDLLNLSKTYKHSSHDASSDPIVTPPIYGQWHAMLDEVQLSTSWLNDLNLDPRTRVVAGLGSGIVREHQEEFMDLAWGQLGEIIAANQKIREAELAREISSKLYEKHLANLPEQKLMTVSEPMHKKILLERMVNNQVVKLTARKEIKSKSQSSSMVGANFRKLSRPGASATKIISKTLSQTNIPVQQDLLQGQLIQKLYSTTITPAAKSLSSDYDSIDSISGNLPANTTSVSQLTIETANAISDSTVYDITSYSNSSQIPPQPVAVSVLHQNIKSSIEPAAKITNRVLRGIQMATGTSPSGLRPIMAYPKFNTPMYELLKNKSSDYIIPNIDLIPNNTIAILENNQKFIEAFMIGLNHEMSRELLWREFPTDQRGTYFKQFWDISGYVHTSGGTPPPLDNISEMDKWTQSSSLGSHLPSGGVAPLVLLVRGELLNKYPNAIIYAQKAAWQKTNGMNDYTKPKVLDESAESNTKFPLFQATVESDITLIGFNLTTSAAKGSAVDPGYFFMIKERPGQIRFGLDIYNGTGNPPAIGSWNDLTWRHLVSNANQLNQTLFIDTSNNITASGDSSASWAASSADMASILYQLPVIVGVHGSDMLPTI